MPGPKAYNFDRQVTSNGHTQSLYLNCGQHGTDWVVTLSGPIGRLQLLVADFEEIACLHLHYQGYTLWTPGEKTAAYAMAHMAGLLDEQDKWRAPK